MKNNSSIAIIRKRKLLLILPILMIPFITLAFWALGGGQQHSQKAGLNTGLNLELPDATLPANENADKLSFYKNADTDSLKKAETLRSDPLYQDSLLTLDYHGNSIVSNSLLSPYSGANTSDSHLEENEKRIYQKIDEINRQITSSSTEPNTFTDRTFQGRDLNTQKFTTDIDKLQDMMQMMNTNEGDPEIHELNGTLEKILDIQHPERVSQKLKEKSLQQKDRVFIVSKKIEPNKVSLINQPGKDIRSSNKFYSLEEDTASNSQNTVEAVVHQTQTIQNGSIVKMRLMTDLYVDGTLIRQGSFIYGKGEINDERLEISISSLKNNNSIFPVKLQVFDTDGIEGISIPNAIPREVAKQSADNSLQLMDLSSADQSVKAQAASTGINVAKNLFSRKVKLVRVTVKAGYKILIKDKNMQD